jgi:hypothetical protein
MNHQAEKEPIWTTLDVTREPDPERCRHGIHTWIAVFFKSGRLAYWECVDCGQKDREIGPLPERLDTISGWIEDPPVLIAHGPRPPASTRRWRTAQGAILEEGDPSSIHFVGLEIPGLEQAHTYVLRDETGKVDEMYAPTRHRPLSYDDHYWLVRYQVLGNELVWFESHCHEDSTYEVPHAVVPKQKVILGELQLLLPYKNDQGEAT